MNTIDNRITEVKEMVNYLMEELNLSKEDFPFIYQFNELVKSYNGETITGLKTNIEELMLLFPTPTDDLIKVQTERFCNRLSMYLENII